MKVLESISLDEPKVVVEGTSEKSSMAMQKVFNNVKRLFYLTSNKRKVLGQYVLKGKTCEKKLKQCKLMETKLNSIKVKMVENIDELKNKLEDAKKLLKETLQGVM